MDKQIKKKRFTVKKVAMYLGIALFGGFIGYQFIFADRRQSLIVEKDKITISEVANEYFRKPSLKLELWNLAERYFWMLLRVVT